MEHCPFMGTCQGLKERCSSLSSECEQLRENDRAMMSELGNVKERMVAAEQSTRSAHHRLDSQEEQTKAIYELAHEVKTVIAQQSEILSLLQKHDGRLDSLEKKPGNSAMQAWKWLLTAVAGGIIGIGFTLLASHLTK